MNKTKGFLRIAAVLSALWLINTSTMLWSHTGFRAGNIDNFVEQGVLPLVIFWGLVWIIAGFRNKDDKTEDEEEGEGESDD
jgi:hypothetical protein